MHQKTRCAQEGKKSDDFRINFSIHKIKPVKPLVVERSWTEDRGGRQKRRSWERRGGKKIFWPCQKFRIKIF